MFASIKSFLNKHKRTLFVSGVAVGVALALGRVAHYKLLQWNEKGAKKVIEKQKRKHHFESTLQTANATTLSLLETVCSVIDKELDIDGLLHAAQNDPASRKDICEELKVRGFCRVLASIYSTCLLAASSCVQLMVLGGYTYSDCLKPGHAGAFISIKMQQAYLLSFQYFVTVGLPELLQQITRAVIHTVKDLPLNQQLSIHQIEAILKDVVLILSGDSEKVEDAIEDMKLRHWSYFVVKAKPSAGDDESSVLYNMHVETSDILDGNDFSYTINSLLQQALNSVMDRIADLFPYDPQPHSLHRGENLEIQPVSDISSDDSLVSEPAASAGSSTEPTFTTHAFPVRTLPVAKLIPILSGLVHSSLSPAPGLLVDTVLNNDLLVTLSFNVYEAFSLEL